MTTDAPTAPAKPAKVEQETILATLVDFPRFKLHLIKYEWGGDRHFLLRRMKFNSPENVRGSEIKIEESAAQVLIDALSAALAAPRLPVEAIPLMGPIEESPAPENSQHEAA
jgi:hypothetical protein